MNEPRAGDRRFQILTYAGIVDQLVTAQANRVLAGSGLPFAQFVMLGHFSHEPKRERTVTETAGAFQVPQPGITKIFQRLVRRGYLAARTDGADGRIKRHVLTAKGAAAHKAAVGRLMPEIARMFEDWTETDIEALHDKLFRLKSWLDADRDPK